MLQPLQRRSEEGWSGESLVLASLSPTPPYTRLYHNAATESVHSARSRQPVSAGPTKGSWLLTLASAVSPYAVFETNLSYWFRTGQTLCCGFLEQKTTLIGYTTLRRRLHTAPR